MREIKFRAWNEAGKAWLEGDELGFSIGFDGSVWSHHFSGSSQVEAILCQYTELQDKNGADIYEGDIVKHEVAYGDNQVRDKICGDVYFKKGSFYVRSDVAMRDGWGHKELSLVADSLSFDGSAKYACEIIGNIYENEELINA